MAKGEFLTGPDPDVDGHLADDAGPASEPLTSRLTGKATPLSDEEQTEHLADDLGVKSGDLAQATGQDDEPSGLADWGHSLAPPG
ncbi:MAG TPA: hypothetical protein VHJ78_04265 [Actinomycetota bacterium]|nr:hypothetical protein [Actinomycetota bacterium]